MVREVLSARGAFGSRYAGSGGLELPSVSIADEALTRWTAAPAAQVFGEILEGYIESDLAVKISRLPLSSCYLIDSGKPGPLCTVSSGVHGDELCGVEASYLFFKDVVLGRRTLDWGAVVIVVGNEEAILENRRCLDVDMNRVFGGVGLEGREVARAKELEAIYASRHEALQHLQTEGAPLVADFHSMSIQSPPVVWGEYAQHRHLPYLGIPNAVLHQRNQVDSRFLRTVQGFSTNHHSLAFTFECGQHHAESTFLLAQRALDHFLRYAGVLPEPAEKTSLERLGLLMRTVENSKGFAFRDNPITGQPWKSFDVIRRNGEIGSDERGVHLMPKDGYILFPRSPKSIAIGEGAVYVLAQQEESLRNALNHSSLGESS
ncbi:succinylglutamate desuccinylase/aspartoacylase family protein [bacterium]|nr:succinylglutamate desuccinylase/aspartoacylase family protein [bacterium]